MRHDIPAQPHGSRSKGPSLCGMPRGVSQSFVSPVFGFSNPNPHQNASVPDKKGEIKWLRDGFADQSKN